MHCHRRKTARNYHSISGVADARHARKVTNSETLPMRPAGGVVTGRQDTGDTKMDSLSQLQDENTVRFFLVLIGGN